MSKETKKKELENKIQSLLTDFVNEFQIEYIELYVSKKQGKFPDKVIKICDVTVKISEEE